MGALIGGLIVAVLGLATALVIVLSEDDSSPTPKRLTYLPCLSGYVSHFTFESRPGHCIEFVDNRAVHAGQTELVHIKWSQWGQLQARGTAGEHFCFTGVCGTLAARVTAGGLRTACGRQVYTELIVDRPATGQMPASSDTFMPPPCGGKVLPASG